MNYDYLQTVLAVASQQEHNQEKVHPLWLTAFLAIMGIVLLIGVLR